MTVVLKKRRNQSSELSTTQVDDNWDTIETALNATGTGDGTVTEVTVGNLSPLFTASVATGTTTPAVSFAQVSQTTNKVLASPNGSTGAPTFRALVSADLPTIPIAKGGTNSTTSLGNNKVMVSSGGAIVESSTITTTELSFLDGIDGLTNGILRKGTSALTTGAINLASADATGITPISKGGLGVSTTPANGQIAIGNGTGYAITTITAGAGMSVTNGVGTITLASAVPSVNSLTGALTVATGTTGSDIAVNSSSTTITINIPTATSSARGALSSTDWSTFNSKIGRALTTGNTISFGYDVWYITGNATLPQITSDDVGKVIFVKNTSSADRTVTAYGTNTIDDNVSTYVTLSHKSGGALQGGVILQAKNTSQWCILASVGTITYG
jgi:hypothetical protein